MGMPGSETALEGLMCRVLGDLLQEGVVAKLADDLLLWRRLSARATTQLESSPRCIRSVQPTTFSEENTSIPQNNDNSRMGVDTRDTTCKSSSHCYSLIV